MEEKSSKLLISHSSEDEAYVSCLVKLLKNIGLSQNKVVCSSVPGYGIPLGNDVYDWLAEQFQKYNIYVLFVLSNNYYNSPACLNEMGAAWVLKHKYNSILLPGFEFREIGGAVNPRKIAIKLDSDILEVKQRLNELKDDLIKTFSITRISKQKWENYRNDFISEINMIAADQRVDGDSGTRRDRDYREANDDYEFKLGNSITIMGKKKNFWNWLWDWFINFMFFY